MTASLNTDTNNFPVKLDSKTNASNSAWKFLVLADATIRDKGYLDKQPTI